MLYKKTLILFSIFSFIQTLPMDIDIDMDQSEDKINFEQQKLNEKLLTVASNGTIDEMIDVIKQEADINYRDTSNRTVLFYVMVQINHIQDDLEKTKLLIWLGLDADIKDDNGDSAYGLIWKIHTHYYGQAIADKRLIINFITKYGFKIKKVIKKFEAEKQDSLKLILENVTHIKDIANLISEYEGNLYDPFELYKFNDNQLEILLKAV